MRVFFSPNTPKFLEEFGWFAIGELGLDKLRGYIDVKYKHHLEANSFGLCWGDRDGAEIHIAHRQEWGPCSRVERCKTLAHELTHARQYLKRELLPNEEGSHAAMWRGERVTWKGDDEAHLPWELEASVQEDLIYSNWLEKFRL